jgi:glycosyltransferase involved in cell wall biosynthesis
MGDANGVPGPIRVAFVDAAGEIPELSPVRPGDAPYSSALVFAAAGGRLIGEVEFALDRPVSPAELREHLRDALGDRFAADPAPPAGSAPDRVDGDAALPFVSVVIATTMERLDELDRCVASLLALDYPAFEVILVDNRPDASAERAALHARLATDPRVRVVTEARVGISAARNRGAWAARGELVAFTDDDAVAHPGWLRGVGGRFAADPAVDCVSGVVLPAELETPAQIWFERSGSKLEQRYRVVTFHSDGTWRGQRLGALRRARFEITATPEGGTPEKHLVYRAGKFGMGANIAFRVAALRSLGGFEETLGTGTAARGAEDIAAIARLLYAGGRITMDPAVIVHHYHRVDYAGSRRQMYGYGVGATAALTALVRSDPRHLIGLLHMALPGVRVLLGKSGERRAGDYPKDLSRVEMRGLLVGPFAYLRSRVAHARSTRAVRRMDVAAGTL